MKLMKLGSKPDIFQSEGSCIRYVSSELATDVIVSVGKVNFHLHKFPLLSKSNKLHKLVSKANEDNLNEIHLVDFPGGPKAFEICAKFCYGITLTLNPYNLVAARCAAEYLEMTEDIDRGNLIFKIEVFLNCSILQSWKDSIIVLQTTSSLLPWSENLRVTGRCIDSIACKTSVDPSVINWSYTYNRKWAPKEMEYVPKDWWIEDICELETDIYKRVVIAIKLKGRMDGSVIGEALKIYAIRWLPDSIEALVSEVHSLRNKLLVETITCLLPSDKSIKSCSCGFLLKLLKVTILVGGSDLSIDDLIKSIGSKLDEACVSDLFIPARSSQSTIYDTEVVRKLVVEFVTNEKSCRDLKILDANSKNDGDFVLGHASWLKVGKIVDSYLTEIARDPNLPVSTFIELSGSIPEVARPIHDGLYGAIDIYLKEHKNLTKGERKNLCGLMDVKKFSLDATTHAAQNEKLPLRLVVQVLFFEQVKAASSIHALNNDALRKQVINEMKLNEEEVDRSGKLTERGSKNGRSGPQLLPPSRSRRFFDKLWIMGNGYGNGENTSFENFASSQSPAFVIKFKGEMKKRLRRYSIS